MVKTRKDEALDRLRAWIADGRLRPGERLSDFALAKTLGVSRTPLREAINNLVAEGLAEAHPHAGVFVRRLDDEDLRELYELREALEGYAAGAVAERGDPATAATLKAHCDTARTILAALPARGDLDPASAAALREVDLAFHRDLVGACGNRRIVKAMADAAIHDRLFATMPSTIRIERLRRAWRMHATILKAIRSGDAAAARDAMAAHIRAGLEHRLGMAAEAED